MLLTANTNIIALFGTLSSRVLKIFIYYVYNFWFFKKYSKKIVLFIIKFKILISKETRIYMRLLRKAFLINTLLVSSTTLFSCSKYRYNQEKVEPTLANKVDLFSSYGNDWTITIYSLLNNANATDVIEGQYGIVSPTKFMHKPEEEVKEHYIYAYLTYYEDRYFSIDYIMNYDNRLAQITYEFYGSMYRYEISGDGFTNGNEISDKVDINYHKCSLNAFNNNYDWSFYLDEYKEKKGYIQGCLHASGNSIYYSMCYSWFYLRRVVKDNYFAINFKSVGSDKKTIIEYYDTNHSYMLYYSKYI